MDGENEMYTIEAINDLFVNGKRGSSRNNGIVKQINFWKILFLLDLDGIDCKRSKVKGERHTRHHSIEIGYNSFVIIHLISLISFSVRMC